MLGMVRRAKCTSPSDGIDATNVVHCPESAEAPCKLRSRVCCGVGLLETEMAAELGYRATTFATLSTGITRRPLTPLETVSCALPLSPVLKLAMVARSVPISPCRECKQLS
jgi:hypothetical protein